MASPFNTGIQRVVRSIVRESESVGQQLGVKCIPVVFTGNGFYPLGQEKEHKISFWNKKLGRLWTIINKLDKLFSRLPFSSPYRRFRSIAAPYAKRLYLFYKENNNFEINEISNLQSLQDHSNASPQEPSAVGASRILLLLDSTWDSRMWGAVDRFRASGGHVCAVLYDLVPFTHPETVEEHTRQVHTSWWLKAPLHVDSVMCISNTVRSQFLQWQEGLDLERKIPAEKVSYFHLGSELPANSHDESHLLQIATSETPYFLVVGSIEPRKNHRVILDAFDILWQNGVAVNLLIVGAHGWKSEVFFHRVANHPMLNKHLFILSQVADAELNCMYKKTTALIIASLEEGFGLPIVEASQRGVDVICSDIPVFHEVAGERATYFDPCDPASLAQVISSRLISDVHCPGRFQKNANWITWRESAEQLITRVLLRVDAECEVNNAK